VNWFTIGHPAPVVFCGMKDFLGFSRLDFAMAIGLVAFVLWMVQLGPFG
jgi:hypothetical protein